MAMHEIICPHCGKAFKIDEAGYADILKQVRDADFQRQLHERLELAEQDKQNAVELAQTRAASESQRDVAARDAQIQELKAKLDASEAAQKLAISDAISAVERERDALATELEVSKLDKQNAIELAQTKAASESQRDAAARDAQIQELKAKLDATEAAQKLAISDAVILLWLG
jgi:hypothetical protein